MTDYTKLVKALRNHASKESDCRSCKYYYYNIVKYDTCSSSLCAAAAAAIEALQAKVKRMEDELSFSESSADEFQMQAALQNALLAKQVPHWVSTEDELPKLPDMDYCHVWCVGWFERGKREERWLLYDRISLPPTKWAYLPQPPQEEQE